MTARTMSHLNALQKWFLHPVTALLLGTSVWHVVSTYSLFDFPFADIVAGVVVAAGYLLLSRRYEKTLSAIFLAFALVVAIKTLPLKRSPTPELSVPEIARRKLHFLAASILLQDLQHPLADADIQSLASQLEKSTVPLEFAACLGHTCPPDWSLQPQDSKDFVLRARSMNPDDKNAPIWYLDSSFQFMPSSANIR